MIKMGIKFQIKSKDLDLIIIKEKIHFPVVDQLILTNKLIKELIVIIFLNIILWKGFLQIVHNIR